ncbi:unnamed protein product [Larinioides sclopetarius]|uniref:Serine/threonine-protein kinase SAK n=2 Tax=Larinioides sclopetarius TaxID=280406 RepID=A0AAV2BRU6_9ARAC
MTDRKELNINKQKFEIELIGRGGFANVYKAKPFDGDGYLGKYVAIKKISKTDTKWSKHKPFVTQEIEIHEKLDHPNIVKLYNVVKNKEAIYLILELCDCSLADYVKKRNCIREEDVYYIFKQIVDGVQYLHSKQVIHRDLTLRNILLTKDMQVKIADFGLSTYLNEADDPRYTVCGTQNYMAPEMKGRKGHKEKVDCWNLGCILYALFDGEPPKTVKGVVVDYPQNISHEAKELLQKLLAKKPTERTCIEAVPNFEFFKKYERTSKSKNSLYRSDDSGNGSRNHLSSPTEKESRFRSLDSGFNSKNSSSKRSNSRRKKYHSEEKLTERRNFDFQKVELLPPQKNFLNNNHTHDRKRSASEDRKPYRPLSCNNPQQMHNSRERSASAERERIEDLKLSCRHDYTNDLHRIISSDCYKSQEKYRNNDCAINSAWNTHGSCNPEPTEHCDDPSCRFSNIVLEGQHKVSPSPCSHTGCFDIKCSHVATCCCHSHSYHKHRLPNINPEKLNKHCQEQITSPLNVARLRPKRHMPKGLNTVLHISADNQVIMEVLKTRKGKEFVFEVIIISTDGMKIKMFKPPKNTPLDDDRPPPFPKDSNEIKSYDYQMLPKMYHKNYLVAKQFVDILRAKKPKFINNTKNGRFYAMENSPDPDMKMEFYGGGSVVKKDQIIYITDKLGQKCVVYDETITKNLNQDFKLMLEEFLNEKEDCERILKFHESLRSPNFPIVLGESGSLSCSLPTHILLCY